MSEKDCTHCGTPCPQCEDHWKAVKEALESERDRLKAELASLSCPICGSDVDGHNWKQRCERLESLCRILLDDWNNDHTHVSIVINAIEEALAKYKASLSSSVGNTLTSTSKHTEEKL